MICLFDDDSRHYPYCRRADRINQEALRSRMASHFAGISISRRAVV
jgi:hypothetical protein